MARKKREDEPKEGAGWLSTFSDLMNLLLCFFVLLFSMSTVDAEKFEMVISSLKASFSVLPSGSDTVGDGNLVGAGVSQMDGFDVFYLEVMNSNGTSNDEGENDASGSASSEKQVEEQYEEMSTSESEEMADEISDMAEEMGITDEVDIDFTSQYVLLELSGNLLFDSGSADIKKNAEKVLDKVGTILGNYKEHIIEVEGHTDNVPMVSDTYANNEVLSTFRAMNVADYLMDVSKIKPSWFKYSGRGEYVPIADNSTTKGRAKNRRVEIKLYNSYNSNN